MKTYYCEKCKEYFESEDLEKSPHILCMSEQDAVTEVKSSLLLKLIHSVKD